MVSMMRKCQNHKLQTNPWHHEDEIHNNYEAQGRQIKQSLFILMLSDLNNLHTVMNHELITMIVPFVR